MRNFIVATSPRIACLVGVVFATPTTSFAQLDACNELYVASDASCEVLVGGGCTVQCEPVAFRATCAADLYVDCAGGCNADVDVGCMATCDVTACEAACTVDPGAFDCEGACRRDVEIACTAECAEEVDESARSRCVASCRSTFVGECAARCEAVPPSADCAARCEASCDGRCRAEARLDCQVDCQADGYVDCEAGLTGGCEAQCMDPRGALFCDGQLIEASDIEACIDELSQEVDVDTSARAECDGGACAAEASVGCAAAPARSGSTPPWGGAALGVGLVALLVCRRRPRG